MRAGRLDQRVTIERRQVGSGGLGQPSNTWVPLATVWASVEPLTGREFIQANTLQSPVAARVRMRYMAGITTADRVVHRGKTYSLEAVIDARSAREELVLMCKG